MADEEKVWIEVSERGYYRDGVNYSEGAVLQIPKHALDHVVESDPPRGRRVSRQYAMAKQAGEDVEDVEAYPAAEEPAYQPDVAASSAARDLAETYDMDLSEVEGTGKDGRVLKEDVEDALEARAEEA